MKGFFKRKGNWFEILFWGLILTFIFGVNPEIGGIGTLCFGLITTGVLILCCFFSRYSLKPIDRSHMQGNRTKEWYLTSPDWKITINRRMMSYDEYLNMYDENDINGKRIKQDEKKREHWAREQSYKYDILASKHRNSNFSGCIYHQFKHYYKNELNPFDYYDQHGTYRTIRISGFEFGKIYANGDLRFNNSSKLYCLKNEYREECKYKTGENGNIKYYYYE